MVCSPRSMESFGQSIKGKDSGGVFKEESAAKGSGSSPKPGLSPSPLFIWVVGFLCPMWHKEAFGAGPKLRSGKTQFSSPAFVRGMSGCQGKFPYPAAFCSVGLGWDPLCS